MTRAARIIPFAYEDFAPKAEAPAPPPSTPNEAHESLGAPRLTEADLEAAFARGVVAGETSAAARAVSGAARIEMIAAGIAAEAARRVTALDHDRSVLRRDVRDFLNAFCRRLAADKAATLALTLVDRLLAGSAGDDAATLFVSEETFAEWGDDLHSALARKAGAASIELGSDGALTGGECRLQWRGGAAHHDNTIVAAEIDRILALARADDTEDSHE